MFLLFIYCVSTIRRTHTIRVVSNQARGFYDVPRVSIVRHAISGFGRHLVVAGTVGLDPTRQASTLCSRHETILDEITRGALRAARVKKRVRYLCRRRRVFITRDALRAARVKKRVGYLCRRRRRVFITRDALRAARVKKRVGYLCRRRRVFIFLRRSHKW